MFDYQFCAASLGNHHDTRQRQSLGAHIDADCLRFALWPVFGLMKAEWPIVITNAAYLMLSAFILSMTVLPRAQKDAVADTIDPTADRDGEPNH